MYFSFLAVPCEWLVEGTLKCEHNLDYGEEKPVKNGLTGSLVTVVCVSFTTQGRRQTIISLGTMEKN